MYNILSTMFTSIVESKILLGLLVASLDDEAQEDLRANKNLGVYKGALYENFAAEALVKQGYGLYYYSKENSNLEEDFFNKAIYGRPKDF
mgnify:FL=1